MTAAGLIRLVSTAALLATGAARADRGELYLSLELAPMLQPTREPVQESATILAPAGGAGAVVLYGLTNELHLGMNLGAALAPNAVFRSVTLPLPETGSPARGDLFEDLLSVRLMATAHYRMDLGEAWAPFARVDAGGVFRQHQRIAHYPSGTTVTVSYPSRQELAPAFAALVGVEYRFWNRWLINVGFRARYALGSLTPWEFELPIGGAFIW